MNEKRYSHTERPSSGEIGSIGSVATNAGESSGLRIDNRNPEELGEKLLASRKSNRTWKLSRIHERMIKNGRW